MDERALELIELPAILERVAGAAASEPGRALALALAPAGDPAVVEARQALTTEAITLLDHAAEPDLAGLDDVRPEAALAGRGGVLDPGGLVRIAVTVRAAVAARRSLDEDGRAPLLAGLAATVEPTLAGLAETIEGAVEEDGSDLRDTASPALRRLRRELRDGRAHLAERLRRLARDPALREHLSEDFVTERGGRPVLALRASARSAVPGIVHDTSGTGQTLFVEPFAVVEESNRLREAESAERDEVARILRTLSGLVGERAQALDALVGAAADLDLALARGALSRRWRGAPVAVGALVRLRGARHPLLDPATAVPIDLELGDLRAVVVSGPNTGGKTVALKTLGLAAALHQCGLRPPAEEAALPVFDQVLVDIGDEQSIAMSLSTFSGHLRSLVGVLDAATDRSLVLLDEVAAGTDPVEGAALAQALLDRLVSQARLTVATSHFAELKEWAASTPGAANAATGFDPETDAPLYRIELGRPGTSHALRIAERLGLPADVVASARGRIAPERLRVAELLAEAEAAAHEAADARARSTREAQAAAAERRELERHVLELEAEAARVRASAQAERDRALARAEQELAGARAELDGLRREIRAARRAEQERRRTAPAASARAERERDRRLGAADARVTRAAEAVARIDEPVAQTVPLAVGDPVVAPAVGVRGTVSEIHGDEATVIGTGGSRIRIPLARLHPDRDAPAEARPAITMPTLAPPDAPFELDLRGRTAQEAREAVRAFVDNASLAGHAEVRVIHGRGTGAVRQAVRGELDRHPLVDEHVPDSADGATVVRLGGGR